MSPSSLSNLALLYEAQIRLADAEPLLNRALAIREKVLGNDHPNTKAARRDLQRLRQSTAPATEVSRDSQSGAGDR